MKNQVLWGGLERRYVLLFGASCVLLFGLLFKELTAKYTLEAEDIDTVLVKKHTSWNKFTSYHFTLLHNGKHVYSDVDASLYREEKVGNVVKMCKATKKHRKTTSVYFYPGRCRREVK
jgi:hypothetical protein